VAEALVAREVALEVAAPAVAAELVLVAAPASVTEAEPAVRAVGLAVEVQEVVPVAVHPAWAAAVVAPAERALVAEVEQVLAADPEAVVARVLADPEAARAAELASLASG
jgi:hypothetical protein